jgi:hypothetical protein
LYRLDVDEEDDEKEEELEGNQSKHNEAFYNRMWKKNKMEHLKIQKNSKVLRSFLQTSCDIQMLELDFSSYKSDMTSSMQSLELQELKGIKCLQLNMGLKYQEEFTDVLLRYFNIETLVLKNRLSDFSIIEKFKCEVRDLVLCDTNIKCEVHDLVLGDTNIKKIMSFEDFTRLKNLTVYAHNDVMNPGSIKIKLPEGINLTIIAWKLERLDWIKATTRFGNLNLKCKLVKDNLVDSLYVILFESTIIARLFLGMIQFCKSKLDLIIQSMSGRERNVSAIEFPIDFPIPNHSRNLMKLLKNRVRFIGVDL